MATTYIAHHGIKGQKWGVRRYQNEDGTLTSAGRKHVGEGDSREARKQFKQERKEAKKQLKRDLKEMRKERKALTAYEEEKHDLTESIRRDDFWNAAFGTGTSFSTEVNRVVRDREVGKKVNEQLLKKYGQQKMDALEKSDNFREGVKIVGALIAGVGMMGAAVAYDVKYGIH